MCEVAFGQTFGTFKVDSGTKVDQDGWTLGVRAEPYFGETERFTVPPFVVLDYVYGTQNGFADAFRDGFNRSYEFVWRRE